MTDQPEPGAAGTAPGPRTLEDWLGDGGAADRLRAVVKANHNLGPLTTSALTGGADALDRARASLERVTGELAEARREVENEQHDVRMLERHCSAIYMHVTSGRISKANTLPEAVIAEADDLESERTDEAIKEATAELVAEVERVTGELAEARRQVTYFEDAGIEAQRERDEARAAVERVTQERDEARAWGDDLAMRAREVTCVWCGHQFESTLQSQADHLYEHAKVCEQHPIRKAEVALAESQRLVARLRDAGEKVVRGIDEWNEGMQKIIGRVPDYRWGALEELRAALSSGGAATVGGENDAASDGGRRSPERVEQAESVVAPANASGSGTPGDSAVGLALPNDDADVRFGAQPQAATPPSDAAVEVAAPLEAQVAADEARTAVIRAARDLIDAAGHGGETAPWWYALSQAVDALDAREGMDVRQRTSRSTEWEARIRADERERCAVYFEGTLAARFGNEVAAKVAAALRGMPC